ncbi:MAG: D-alanine--D-alanine ligase [Proteobacteria bacterium]|nr:D-alanine--D-alanine ligase [Pseudomonadota bacterium]MBU1738838.1 D-alanine--D-alanine ligase [Pseudomonadota bacterium]
MAAKLTVALLAGGRSSEREVSLKGGEEVYKALDKKRYEIRRYDPATDLGRLAAEAAEIDVAFILLHGPFGEDGTMQGFLDMLDIPYQGAGVLGSAMAMDKHVAKLMYRQAGLTVPDWHTVEKGGDWSGKEILAHLGLPLVIKPLSQGSSVGMSIVDNGDELGPALDKAFAFDRRVMIEKFIAGREITGGVIGNDEPIALPLVEIIPGDQYRFFDYEAKYQPGASREICPAEFDDLTTVRAQEFALAAHRALMLEVYSRTDMIVNDSGIYVLETNTIPGMTPTSLLPQAARAHGLSFPAFLDRLLELALEKKR